MKRSRFLTTVAALIFAVGGFAFAQEGYYGQQATTDQSAQQTESSPRQVACACGRMHGNAGNNHPMQHGQHMRDGGASQPDRSAPQNLVEYGG